MDIQGTIVWITGGSSGIGYATAETLGRYGARIALSARNAETLDAAVATLSGLGVDVTSFPLDVRDERSVKEVHEQIVQQMGPVQVLVNAAGISPFTTFSETSAQEFDEVIHTNLYGMFLASRAVLPGMYAVRTGAIVQLLSIASAKAFKGGAAYIASKFGGHGFTNALREESRKHGVKVIAILPGATDTAAWGDEEREKFRDRMMQPEDIALAILHALEQPQRMMTEEVLIRPIGGDL